MADAGLLRTVVLCADDYGLTAEISAAICALLTAGRLAATSCMVLPGAWSEAARQLRELSPDAEIGLHFTMTDHEPSGPLPNLAPDGRLPKLPRLMVLSLGGRIDRREVTAELHRQIDRFTAAIGRPPDFLDGHQHVHQFPGIRHSVLTVFAERLRPAGAWLRIADPRPIDVARDRQAVLRNLTIAALGAGFRRRAERLGMRVNDSFGGVRGSARGPSFQDSLDRWLAVRSARPLIICHPGLSGDPFAVPEDSANRREEYDVLRSQRFPEILSRHHVRLGPLPS